MQPHVLGATGQTELDRLTSEHRALKARLHELDKHHALTSAEQVERAQLQRLELRAHEHILRLQEH